MPLQQKRWMAAMCALNADQQSYQRLRRLLTPDIEFDGDFKITAPGSKIDL